jgi:hypothetical protein
MQPFSSTKLAPGRCCRRPGILVSEWADRTGVLTGGAAAERANGARAITSASQWTFSA